MAMTREIKVGVFVLLGLILSGVVVFMIGDERNLFARKTEYVTTFSDVQGLSAGAPVRMNGINIGSVSDVSHSSNIDDPRIHVQIWIVRSEAVRLREDARAKVANKGLLGDKMLEIEPGTGPAREQLGGEIVGEDPTDFSNIVGQVGSIAERANSVLGNLDRVTASLADDNVQENIRGTVDSVNIILKNVAEGDGYVNRLLTDPQEADRLSRTIANLEKTSSELASTMVEVRHLVARVNTGPGFVHSVVYDQDGTQAVNKFGDAANEIALTLRGVREGDGLARAMLYGGSTPEAQIVANLSAASADLRDIIAGLKRGKGTIGALLVDPSVYEDMKVLLGNVERNDVLRALVRYSIRQDETRPAVQVTDPQSPIAPPQSTPTSTPATTHKQ